MMTRERRMDFPVINWSRLGPWPMPCAVKFDPCLLTSKSTPPSLVGSINPGKIHTSLKRHHINHEPQPSRGRGGLVGWNRGREISTAGACATSAQHELSLAPPVTGSLRAAPRRRGNIIGRRRCRRRVLLEARAMLGARLTRAPVLARHKTCDARAEVGLDCSSHARRGLHPDAEDPNLLGSERVQLEP